MPQQDPQAIFDQKCASHYDQQWIKLAPLREALHLLIGAVLADLPAESRVLCVGAGTGAELIYLAQQYPGWRFTAVEPSGPMLEVCRRKTQECGIADRCEFHVGFLDSLPPSEPFDAATSLLVSQFILDREARTAFFRGIAERLRPGGYLISSDLSSDTGSALYQELLGVWLRMMRATGVPAENLERLRAAYGRDVALLPVKEVSALISSGGFDTPVQFCQTCLIHAWYARRLPTARADAALNGAR